MIYVLIVALLPIVAIVVRARKVFRKAVLSNQNTYYYMLSNGATSFEAFVPYMRSTLKTMLRRITPQAKIALPAVLLGLLLGGGNPLRALLLSVVVVLAILAASFALSFIVIEIERRRMVDDHCKIK